MKTVVFVPTVCKGEAPKFEGSVELKKLNFDEKCELLEEMGEIKDDGQLGTIKRMRKIAALSEKFYQSVNLKSKETGEEFKSFESLSEESDLHTVLIEVSTQLVEGFKTGNG